MTKDEERAMNLIKRKKVLYLLHITYDDDYETYCAHFEGLTPEFTKREFDLIKNNEAFLKEKFPNLYKPLIRRKSYDNH